MKETEVEYSSFLEFPEEQSIYVEVPVKFNIENLEKIGENQVYEYCKSLYGGKILRNYPIYDDNKTVDLFFPEINFAIDFHSLEYACEKALMKRNIKNPVNYHLEKWLQAKEKNIRLVQIFSDEWLFRNEICKKILKNILKPTDSPIPARKCFVDVVNANEARDFYERYHLQGFTSSTVHLGLYYGNEIFNELVSIVSFSKSRLGIGAKPTTKEENIWELTRYAIKGDIRIIGGFEKILKNFIKMYSPKSIYTFIDNRWFDGQSLARSHFIREYEYYAPGYWYTKDFYTRKHRFSFRKDALKRKFGHLIEDIENWTERTIMEELGFSKIYDCGHAKWWYHVKQ